MMDGTKIWEEDNGLFNSLLINPLLELQQITDINTGEIFKYIGKNNGLTFKISPSGHIEIGGSLHKFHNKGTHNYDDFNIYKLRETIEHLSDCFNINPYTATIHKLEFGLNLITPFNPTYFLNSLVSYRGKQFNDFDKGEGKLCNMTQYSIKIYNKSLQYHLGYYLLRVEISVNKMQALNTGPIFLVDLKSLNTWQICFNQLLKAFNMIVIKDDIIVERLSPSEKEFYCSATNPETWKNHNMKPRERYNNILKFNDINNNYGQNRYAEIIKDSMEKKYSELIHPAN